MKKTLSIVLFLCMGISLVFGVSVHASSVGLSEDEQWIVGVSKEMEYITETTYKEQNAGNANNPYWTSLSGGTRPDGSKYANFPLIEGNKLQVASAWYGQDVYFRKKGSSGKGTVVKIPDYSQLKEQYKRSIRVLNPYSLDTNGSFYREYIRAISDENGYLKNTSSTSINISVQQVQIQKFNEVPDSYLTDAEGNYIYDLVAVGAYTDQEPDLSGKAAWALQRYVKEGYGFLIGHDTMYGYGGVHPDPSYTPDPNDTRTPMYQLDTKIDGHWNMNWLMGINKLYTQTSPYKAPSLILNMGDYTDKSTLYGNVQTDAVESGLRPVATVSGNPETDVDARTPANYPYSKRWDGSAITDPNKPISIGVTHSNQQLAYGKIWFDFDTKLSTGKLVTDRNEGLVGTNNFYLTTNGNFGMMQIGHLRSNLNATKIDECRILANTILYLSQRKPCQVCRSQQADNRKFHAVTRIHSAEELARIGDKKYWFTYPTDGCYELVSDIVLPENWKPIEGFSGHFNADGHSIVNKGKAVFAQKGSLLGGWNLGSDPAKGVPSIYGMQKTTGVARLSGHLNQLFGTPSNTDYSRFRVVVTGSDGKRYDCITDREGKYVISNLPCTDVKMTAQVFDPTGREMTEYGQIYAKIPKETWNQNQTYRLRLESEILSPVPNQEQYEDADVTFTARINGRQMPQSIVWQYRYGAGYDWQNVSSSSLFVPTVSSPELVAGDNPYIESRLTIPNVQLDWNKMEFRAVFRVNGKEYNTFDAKTEGAAGLLSVRERPYVFQPIADVTVWQGETAQFTADFSYYRSFKDGLSVKWQFRGGENVMWDDVENSTILQGATVANHVTTTNHAQMGYLNRSVLSLPANMDYDKYQFRAVIDYPAKKRVFASDQNFHDGYKGQLNIQVKDIVVTKHPQNQKAELQGETAIGRYRYLAEFEYTSKTPEIAIDWQFKPKAQAGYQPVSAFPFSNVLNVQTNAPVALGNNRYRVTTTLTLTNPPKDLDSGSNHYYFRAVAQDLHQVATLSGDISYHYRIDIQPGKPAIRIVNGQKVYTYPNLQVYAPNGVQHFRVHFTNQAPNQSMTSADPLAQPLDGNGGFGYNGQTLSAKQVEQYLRQVQMTTANQSQVKWFISDTRLPDGFDPYSGKYYEYVDSPSISWTSARDAANARYHPVLQANGRLATISSFVQQEQLYKMLQGRIAWLGGTNDPRYNTGHGEYRWIDGSGLSYSLLLPPQAGTRYLRILPDGHWQAALNINQVGVTATDLVNWQNWQLVQGQYRTGEILAETPLPTNITNQYTGLTLMAPDSNHGQNSIAKQDLPLVNGHIYWIYGGIGEIGDSNGNMALETPLGNAYSSWLEYPDMGLLGLGQGGAEINQIVPFHGATGSYPFVARTNGNGPNRSGVSGQLFHLQVVDLTQAGAEIPSVDWLKANLGVYNGSKQFSLNSNQSDTNGYFVEYIVDDNRLEQSEKTASATDQLDGSIQPPPPPKPKQEEYRTNTEVIFSCEVTALAPIHPENPASVTFTITDPSHTTTKLVFDKVTLPMGESERAWVRFPIPDVEGDIRVEISCTENVYLDTSVITGTVRRIAPNDPPDPKFADPNPKYKQPALPDFPSSTQHTWTTYTATKVGEEWQYQQQEHKAGLQSIMNIQPDERVKTAVGKEMKSGYGLNATLTAKHGSTNPDAVVAPQTVVSYFPEFQYKTYWRILERIQTGAKQSIFQFAPNPYSQYQHRVHFTPLWYPDTEYVLWTMVRDMWTPVGELKQSCTDTLQIQGNLYDDWYIREMPK